MFCTVAAVSSGCADSSAEQAGRSKEAVRAVKTDAVRQDSVRRTLEVVGTLAAEDQVTVSSEVDGVVRRVLADLGDRVTAGQQLVELDREKLQYNLDQQRAAHARSLTKYGATDAEHLPRIEDTPDARRASAELAQAKQMLERATELHRRQLIPQQTLDDAETTLRLKTAAYDAALQEAKNLQADIDASEAAMTVLPLSIPFALFTIWATGRTLNLWSALGILLLFGIVKKNSILQVDYTNVLRAQGVPRDQAIMDACRTRLRPILMTTLAIIFGLLPTALGVGIGGAQRSAIAVTIIGAQSLCLFLTLLLVPAAYVKLDALEQSLANQRLSAWLSKLRVWGPGRRASTGELTN